MRPVYGRGKFTRVRHARVTARLCDGELEVALGDCAPDLALSLVATVASR